MDILGSLFERFFPWAPKIRRNGHRLIAKTSGYQAAAKFGFSSLEVICDSRQRAVHIFRRTCWFFTSRRRVGFEEIAEIGFGYGDQSIGWARESSDRFETALILHTGEIVNLFNFRGSGGFTNDSGFPDWMYISEHIEGAISNSGVEGEAELYADCLSIMIGVPVGGIPD